MHDSLMARAGHRFSIGFSWTVIALAAFPVPAQDIRPAGAVRPKLFDTCHDGPGQEDAASLAPWKRIVLDPVYRGAWIVGADVDGDRQAEIVSARNHNQNDVHYTCSVVVQRLDGSVLWRWGNPHEGRNQLHHDVACQVYDWDGDQRNEVVVAAKEAVVVLDGATGNEKRRFAIPPGASDCIVFCNLSGTDRPADILVKTRYTQIWAYDYRGQSLWTAELPGGQKTAHQPRPIDIDHDGKDEIVAGFAVLNGDGSLRWALNESDTTFAVGKPLRDGHLDCARLFAVGDSPAQTRLAMTFCGGERLAMVTGDGRFLWNLAGHHFESIDVGKVCRDEPGQQIVVDVPYAPWGEKPIWVLNEKGELLGQILNDESRFHRLVDWLGTGVESIVVGQPPAMYDGSTGKKLAVFDMPVAPGETAPDPKQESIICLKGDMTGDGRPDIIYSTNPATAVYIYENKSGRQPDVDVPLGTGKNLTLY